MKLLFADAHAHSNPVNGLGVEKIVERFKKMGGWFIALVILPPWHYGIEVRGFDDYVKAIELHIRQCKIAREKGLKVSCFAGFHPAEVDKLVAKGLTLDKVLELGSKVIDYVANLCRNGLIDGIGEVGRQHFKTMPENIAVAETLMIKALTLAKDYDCLVQLHLENAGPITVLTLENIVDLIGVNKHLIFIHHAKPNVAKKALQAGYWATIPGHINALRYSYSSLSPEFLIESDYIDDPHRPCVSSCPWEIIERQITLLNEGVISEEVVYKVNVDNVVKAFRVEPP